MELKRVKQVLVDNGYSNRIVDQIINNKINKYLNRNNNNNTINNDHITFYYRNIMNNQYKIDEKIITDIIKKNIKSVNPNQKIKLLIYYKNSKTANRIIKNNTSICTNPLQKSYVVYQYNCPIEGCDLQTYIGMTTTTLSRRLTCHLRNGGPSLHMEFAHQRKITRKDLVDNTKIIDRTDNFRKLQMMEALYIKDKEPSINKQLKSTEAFPHNLLIANCHYITSTFINNMYSFHIL